MARFCAFLRGINVNGKTMKMADVCQVIEQAGLHQVSSVLASGNILFESSMPMDALRPHLEHALSAHYAFDVFLFVKTEAQVRDILSSCPFAPESGMHVYAFVGEPGSESRLMDEYRQCSPIEGEQADIRCGVFFWRTREGRTLDSGFSKALGKKNLRTIFTSRNIQTVEKIVKRFDQ